MVPARVSVVAKTRSPNPKLRLVHDLRRSGANALAELRESVVLPRMLNSVHMVLDLPEAGALPRCPRTRSKPADFLDAFRQCRTRRLERRFLAGEAIGRSKGRSKKCHTV